MRSVKRLMALLAGVISAFSAAELEAQQVNTTRRPTRVPVTLALVDTLSAMTPFRILRRTDLDPHDVILLRPGVDSASLSAAVDQLLLLRHMQGDTAAHSGMMRVRPRDSAGRAPRMLPWARRVVNDLHAATPRSVAGVGDVRAVVIWLPPQRRRTTQP